MQFFPALYGNFFEVSNKLPSNPVVHELKLMGFARASAYIDEFRPDAVISTFPVAGGVVSDIKASRPLVSATIITDFGVHRRGSIRRPTSTSSPARRSERTSWCAASRGTGSSSRASPSPRSSRSEFDRSALRRELGLADRFTALLTAASGQPGDARDIASQLAGWGIQVAAVTGNNARLKRRLDSLAKKKELVRVFGYTSDMHKMMRAADVLVGKAGGLTVSEALAVGLPLIIYNPVPGQELYNVDFLVNFGAGLLSRDEDDVVEKVRFLSTHPERLKQMTDDAAMLGKPSAARACASECSRR